MLIACKCLNITIDVKGAEFRTLNLSMLSLTPIEESDDFFRENLCEAETATIKKQVESLVRSRAVGRFVVVQCLNCLVHCYATYGAASTLVSAHLVTDPSTLLRLQSLADYSPGFRIVLKPTETGGELMPKPKSGQTTALQKSLVALQEQLTSMVRDQVSNTEERVRLFSEQQFSQLQVFRDRAHKDHNALVQILQQSQNQAGERSVPPLLIAGKTVLVGIATPPATPPSPVSNGSPVTPLHGSGQARRLSGRSKTEVMAIPSGRRHPPNRSLSLFTTSKAAGSLDTEGLFDLEGMEDQNAEHNNSECESDTDHEDSGSHDEGIDLHRKRASSISIAKSLPVNVPVYPGNSKLQPQLDLENEDIATNTADIAASIKALARSVHGEAVFGDLPRPRFSTHM